MTDAPHAIVNVTQRMTVTPRPDAREEVRRVLQASEADGVLLRAVGGLAVRLRCPSARRPPLARDYKDIDLIGRAGAAPQISKLVVTLGYVADEEFNALHGHQRLYFWDAHNSRQLDVFIERITMCHELHLRDRLDSDDLTLSLADLLLTKIQVVEINEKDLKDAAALLADHDVAPEGIEPGRVVSLFASDWGWWRTGTRTLRKVADYARSLESFDGADVVAERVDTLLRLIDEAPKSRKWKLRSLIGERARWYELPEELGT